MTNYIKQPSSRPVLTSTSTSNPTKAGPFTVQIRVVGSAAGNLGIADSSSTSVSAPVLVPIVANMVGEYFAITPGQWYSLGAGMSVTEMT